MEPVIHLPQIHPGNQHQQILRLRHLLLVFPERNKFDIRELTSHFFMSTCHRFQGNCSVSNGDIYLAGFSCRSRLTNEKLSLGKLFKEIRMLSFFLPPVFPPFSLACYFQARWTYLINVAAEF